MENIAPRLLLPEKPRWHFFFLGLLLAASAAAFLFIETARGQEGPEFGYVDLVMLHEYQSGNEANEVLYKIRNNGTATATGVTVSFLLEDLEVADFQGYTPTTSKTGTTQSFTVEVGTLTPGGSVTVAEFSTTLHSARHSEVVPNWPGLVGVINATADSLEPELDILRANNVLRVYSFIRSTAGASWHMTDNKLALLLSVDDLRPSTNSPDVEFEITAHNQNVNEIDRRINLIADAKVRVELSDGLRFKDSWSPPTAFVKSGNQSATWYPADTDRDLGAGQGQWHPESDEIEIETQLTPGVSLEDIPLEERCITSWVEDSLPPPSPDYVLGSLKQCLGDDPPVLINSGAIDLLTVQHCVKVDNRILHPCQDSENDGTIDNTLELVAKLASPTLRHYGIGRFDAGSPGETRTLLRPRFTVAQIKDPEGRREASGNIVWNSGSQSTGSDAVGNFPGAILDLSLPYAALTTSNDKSKEYTFSISDMTPGGKPGSMKALAAQLKSVTVLDVDGMSYSGDTGGGEVPLWFEFGELGTYQMNIAIQHSEGALSQGSASGTYTFHVGPVAELEVRDGGPGFPPSGSRAYTIVAVNHGPDTAPAARVTLTGLPASPKPDYTATKGTLDFDDEADGGDGAWVWTIGEMAVTNITQIISGREGEILTIAAGGSSEISATIENAQDYQVCIDGSGNDVDAATESACTTGTNTWHSTNYYDYDDGNNTATITARPGTGSALRASQATAGIGLAWPARSGAVSYGIEVSEDGGATWRLLQSGVRGTGYTHTGIPIGATRHYQVHAVDREGNPSLPFARTSAVAGGGSRETSPAGAPEQMTLNATPASRTEILLRWVKPADYGSPITGYTLQAANGRNGPWLNVDPQPGTHYLDYTYGGLEPNTRKYFRIRAANEFGSGLWSEVAEGRTLAAGVPGEPRNVGAAPFGDNAASVFWQSPDDSGSPVTQYEAQWSSDGATGWSRVGSTGDTSLNHTGLTAGATYFYQVRARNSAGWGPWSLMVSSVPAGVQLPGAPYPRPERNGSTAMDIVWEPPQEDGGGDITGYQLEWSATGVEGTFRSLASPSASSRSHTHTGLTPGAEYHYRMRARNSAGWGEWSETAWDSTERAVVPDAPNLKATANGSREINLSWNKPDGSGARITEYELEYYDAEYEGWLWLTADRLLPGTTHHTHEGLAPGTERRYRIRAYNENGPGQASAVRTARTDSSELGAPTGLTAAADGEKRIDLEWAALEGASSYRIERSRYERGPWERLSNGQGSTTYTDTRDLYPGMTRYYRVAGTGSGGTGAWSEAVAGTTDVLPGNVAARPPDAPTHLRFTSVGQDQVSLAWDKPASDGGAPVTGYEYRETFAGESLTTTGTTGTIRGLDEGPSYYSFEVRAVNAVGEGEWSESVYVTLWPERSEQVRVSPTNITVTEGGTFTFTVSLNRQPPLPVGLGIYPRGSEADELLWEAYQYLDKVLIPNGWSHPDGYDWSDRAHSWSGGVPVSITIPEDDDADDEVMIIDVEVSAVSVFELGAWEDEWNAKWEIDPDRPCPGDPASTCPTEWDIAPWRSFTGPSVRITVRDND